MELERLVDRFEQRLAALRQKEGLTESKRLFAEIKLTYYRDLLKAARGERPVVWSAGTLPTEIITCAGAIPFMPEVYATQIVLSGEQNVGYLDQGAGTGMSERICKGYLAAAGMAAQDRLPQPAAVIASNLPCDSSTVLYRFFSHQQKSPFFPIHVPLANRNRLEEVIAYYRRQLEQSATFLAQVTGTPFDRDRFAALVDLSRQSYNFLVKIHQALRSRVPNPISSRLAGAFPSAFSIARGVSETGRYYQALYEELLAQAGNGEEGRRIGWLGVYPFCGMSLLERLRVSHRTGIVIDFGNFIPEPELEGTGDPFLDLARRDLHSPGWRICWPYPEWREEFLAQVERFRLDAFILYQHQACANINSLGGLIKADLQDMGLPVLILEGEPVDPRIMSTAWQEERIDNFFDTFFG